MPIWHFSSFLPRFEVVLATFGRLEGPLALLFGLVVLAVLHHAMRFPLVNPHASVSLEHRISVPC